MVKAIGGNSQIVSSETCSNDWGGAFAQSTYLSSLDLAGLDVSEVDDMDYMFMNDNQLKTITGLDTWDTSKVRSTSSMFCQDQALNTIEGMENWNFALNTDTSFMFADDISLKNIGDLNNWNTSNITSMACMFDQDSCLTSIGDIRSWNVSNVKSMYEMFYGSGIKQLDISGWHFNDSMAQLLPDKMGITL